MFLIFPIRTVKFTITNKVLNYTFSWPVTNNCRAVHSLWITLSTPFQLFLYKTEYQTKLHHVKFITLTHSSATSYTLCWSHCSVLMDSAFPTFRVNMRWKDEVNRYTVTLNSSRWVRISSNAQSPSHFSDFCSKFNELSKIRHDGFFTLKFSNDFSHVWLNDAIKIELKSGK